MRDAAAAPPAPGVGPPLAQAGHAALGARVGGHRVVDVETHGAEPSGQVVAERLVEDGQDRGVGRRHEHRDRREARRRPTRRPPGRRRRRTAARCRAGSPTGSGRRCRPAGRVRPRPPARPAARARRAAAATASTCPVVGDVAAHRHGRPVHVALGPVGHQQRALARPPTREVEPHARRRPDHHPHRFGHVLPPSRRWTRRCCHGSQNGRASSGARVSRRSRTGGGPASGRPRR